MNNRLWPYSPRAALLSSFVILGVLFFLGWLSRSQFDWPSVESEPYFLVGIFIIGFLPVFFLLIDLLVGSRATVGIGAITLDFSGDSPARLSTFEIPMNLGVRSEPAFDNNSAKIVDELRSAIKNDVVVLDLEDGEAWWDTRLLVLLSGAVRLGRPRILIFLATESGKDGVFQGWGFARDLHRILLGSNSQFEQLYYTAQAAANQWAHLEPPPPEGAVVPVEYLSGHAAYNRSMAFEGNLPNTLAAEQLLATLLAHSLESRNLQKKFSADRLHDLFFPVLRRDSVDRGASTEDQLKQFASSDGDYIVVTEDGRYVQTIRRLAILSSMLSSIAENRD